MNNELIDITGWGGIMTAEHRRRDESGEYRTIHKQVGHNLVTTEGMAHILDVIFNGATLASSTWYIGLIGDNTTPVVGDTYAAPAFAEAAGYDEATRVAYVEAAAAGTTTVVTTNSASKATFTLDGTDATIYGAFVCSNSTKDDTVAASAVLMAAKLFSSSRPVVDDDQLLITYSFSLTNAA